MSQSDYKPIKTEPEMFDRLRQDQTIPRNAAWDEFRSRYAPVIAGFARNCGAAQQDIDDVIQDVMLGFFSVSEDFVYDPKKGRFRGYLKAATINALRSRFRKVGKQSTISLDDINPNDVVIQESWDHAWEKALLQRALQSVRLEYENNTTFQAFDLYVMQNQDAESVAASLKLSIDSVYQAKTRILAAVKKQVELLRQQEEHPPSRLPS